MTTVPIARILVSLAAAIALSPSVNAAEPQPHIRSFHFEYKAMVKEIPLGAKQVDLWVPVPHDDAYQQIRNLRIDSPYAYKIATSSHDNTMLHVRSEDPKESTFTVTLSFDATRGEHIQSRLFGGPAPGARGGFEGIDAVSEAGSPGSTGRSNSEPGLARSCEKANAHTDLEMARAIYNHVVSTVKYDKTGKGWGRGDIYYACKRGAAIVPTFMPSSSAMPARLGYRLASRSDFRSRPIGERGRSPVTIVGPSSMPRESVGCRSMLPKLGRIRQSGSTSLEPTTRTGSNFRKAATSC